MESILCRIKYVAKEETIFNLRITHPKKDTKKPDSAKAHKHQGGLNKNLNRTYLESYIELPCKNFAQQGTILISIRSSSS